MVGRQQEFIVIAHTPCREPDSTCNRTACSLWNGSSDGAASGIVPQVSDGAAGAARRGTQRLELPSLMHARAREDGILCRVLIVDAQVLIYRLFQLISASERATPDLPFGNRRSLERMRRGQPAQLGPAGCPLAAKYGTVWPWPSPTTSRLRSPASTWKGTRRSVRDSRRRRQDRRVRGGSRGRQARRARGVISMPHVEPFEAEDDQDVTLCRDAGSETIDAEESADEYIDEEVTV